MSGDSLGLYLEQETNALENNATGLSSGRFFSRIDEFENSEAPKGRERLTDLLQSIPKSTVGFNRFENESLGIATVGDLRIDSTEKFSTEITDEAEQFISRQKKSVKYRTEVFSVADKVSQCLNKKGINAEVIIDLFTDPEDTCWTEPQD